MPRPDLSGLQNELLRSGISPRHVRRMLAELDDHYDDLVASALADGEDGEIAQARALRELGDLRDIAGAMRAQPELRSWAFRFPHVAVVVYPLTCLAILPAVPVLIGVANAAHLARWATCILLGGLVTASMFLFLQLAIVLT